MRKHMILLILLLAFGAASAQVTTSTDTKATLDGPTRDTLQVETQIRHESDIKSMDAVKTADHTKAATKPVDNQPDVKIDQHQQTAKTQKTVRKKAKATVSKKSTGY